MGNAWRKSIVYVSTAACVLATIPPHQAKAVRRISDQQQSVSSVPPPPSELGAVARNYAIHNPSVVRAWCILEEDFPAIAESSANSNYGRFGTPPAPILKAAEAGDLRACFALGMCLQDSSAVGWLALASDKGYAPAHFALGNVYMNGDKVEKNESEAMRYFMRGAESVDPNAMNSIGDMYEHGKGVERDMILAAEWYRMSAELGNPMGMNNLARCYSRGMGVTEDKDRAKQLFQKAASAELDWAWSNLASIAEEEYNAGTGDFAPVYRYRLEAAIRGHVPSQSQMGLYCQLGSPNNDVDLAAAAKWYALAASRGDILSIRSLGEMYENGTGFGQEPGPIPQDEKKAFACYLKGAEMGDPVSQYRLGLMYLGGRGTEKSVPTALEWIEKSALQGCTPAMDAIKESPELREERIRNLPERQLESPLTPTPSLR